MLAEGSRAARRRLQVPDRRVRAKLDPAPSRPPAVRELALEIVGDANEILVESAELRGHRFLRTEKLPPMNPSISRLSVEANRFAAHDASGDIVIPGLQDAAGHQPVSVAMRTHMRGHQIGERHDVVVQKEHDVFARLRASPDSSPPESTAPEAEASGPAPLRSFHLRKHRSPSARRVSALSDRAPESPPRPDRAQQRFDRIDQDLFAPVGRDCDRDGQRTLHTTPFTAAGHNSSTILRSGFKLVQRYRCPGSAKPTEVCTGRTPHNFPDAVAVTWPVSMYMTTPSRMAGQAVSLQRNDAGSRTRTFFRPFATRSIAADARARWLSKSALFMAQKLSSWRSRHSGALCGDLGTVRLSAP